MNGVLESYEKVETLCKNANNLQDDEIENEIKQLDEQEKRMEKQKVWNVLNIFIYKKQKALVEARIEAVTKEIEDIKALQEDAKNKAEENKQYQKEYLKEVNETCFPFILNYSSKR